LQKKYSWKSCSHNFASTWIIMPCMVVWTVATGQVADINLRKMKHTLGEKHLHWGTHVSFLLEIWRGGS
jgi:hypothetical protein